MKSKPVLPLIVILLMLTSSGNDGTDRFIHIWGNLLWSLSPITVDHNGNIYLSGEFEDTVYFGSWDNWLVNLDSSDYFIIKYYPDGTVAWKKVVTGMGSEQLYDMKVDDEGFVFLTGQYDQAMLMDDLYLDIGMDSEHYLCKLDPDGNLVAMKRGSEDGEDLIINRIDLDDSGRIYVSGRAPGDRVFGHPIDSATRRTIGGDAGFLAQLGSDFTANWVITVCDSAGLSYTDGCFCTAIAVDPDNHLYAAGYADSSPFSYTFISKISQDGQLLWMDTIPMQQSMGILDVFINEEQDVYMITGSNPDIQFNFPVVTSGDAILAKYTKEGEYIWSKGFSPNWWTYVVTREGYTVASYYTEWYKPDGLMIIDPEGEIVYDHLFDSIEFHSLVIDEQGNVFYNGSFSEEISLGNDVFSPQAGNNYVFGQLKVEEMLSGSYAALIKKQDPYPLYPNPANGEINFSLSEGERVLQLEIFDLSGKLLHHGTGAEVPVNLERFKDGIYMVRLRTSKRIIIDKIVINK